MIIGVFVGGVSLLSRIIFYALIVVNRYFTRGASLIFLFDKWYLLVSVDVVGEQRISVICIRHVDCIIISLNIHRSNYGSYKLAAFGLQLI